MKCCKKECQALLSPLLLKKEARCYHHAAKTKIKTMKRLKIISPHANSIELSDNQLTLAYFDQRSWQCTSV